jgi:hypothetical protein
MLESAHYLCNSAEMNADPFSDILKLMQAETLVTGGFSAGGAWSLRFPAPEKIKFFAVVKGNCWVCIDGEVPVQFNTGDVGLLTAKRSFVLASAPEVPPQDAMRLFSGAGRSTATVGDGQDFAHIGGHVLLDPASGRLLADVLPPWIHVPAASPQATTFRWLLDQLLEERAGATGATAVHSDFAGPPADHQPDAGQLAARVGRSAHRAGIAADARRSRPRLAPG